MKTPEVRAALRARHGDKHAWVCVEEAHAIDFLALACHSASDRRDERNRADARYPWVGYEIKVSRSDFRREIANPHKRAYAMSITNEFYFCAPRGLIKPHEVPEGCGLVEALKAGTRTVVKAPIREAEVMDQYRVALMMRHAVNPSWLRNMEIRKASMRYRERVAEEARQAALDVMADARAVLAARLGHTVTPGSSWVARRGRSSWLGKRVVVREVSASTVRYESPEFSWSPRADIGEFLFDYEPADAVGRMAA